MEGRGALYKYLNGSGVGRAKLLYSVYPATYIDE